MARKVKPLSFVFFCYLLFSGSVHLAYAQNNFGGGMREGNKAYKQNDFSNAESAYRKSLESKPNNPDALYNLGNSLYQQGRFEEAKEAFDAAKQFDKKRKAQAEAMHNYGNSLFQEKKYQEAAQAFKEALKLNPADDDSRYNLAQALRRIQSPPPSQENQKNNDKNSGDSGENKEEGQNQNPNESNETSKNDPNPNSEGSQKDKNENRKSKQFNEGESEGIEEGDANRLLDALDEDEKKLQKKLMQEKRKKQLARKTGEKVLCFAHSIFVAKGLGSTPTHCRS